MTYSVLLTRPIDDSKRLAKTLAQENIHSFYAPMMDIVFDPTMPFPPIAKTTQAFLFTSAYGVDALVKRTKTRLPSLTIGPQSAARAQSHALTPVISGDGRRISLLKQALRHFKPQAGSLYHPCGTIHAGDTTQALMHHGFTIHSTPLYRADPVAALSSHVKHALYQRHINAILFFSARTASLFTSTLIKEGIPAHTMTSLHAFALNDTTATALRPIPFKAIHRAKRPTQHHMLEALLCHRHHHSQASIGKKDTLHPIIKTQ